jgi:signal transduction histidine kinase
VANVQYIEEVDKLRTDRKRAEELQQGLMHSDHLVTVGQLPAGVAHEINNPLAYVMANLQVAARHLAEIDSLFTSLRETLENELGEDAARTFDRLLAENNVSAVLSELQKMSTESLEGSGRIRDIVRDLRSFSRIERDTIDLVDLNDIIESTCNLVASEIRHRAELIKDFGRLPKIAVDRGKLSQVMTNLIINAAQSINEGAADRNKVKITTERKGDSIVAIVEDTGCGIPASQQARIFDPFFTTKRREMGAGLGLSLSAEIVRKHGGEIKVESVDGKGSRFEVILPVDTGLAVSARSTVPPPPVAMVNPRARVLAVDDEPMILKAYKRFVGMTHELVTATGGEEALDILEHDNDFDVVICDLMMPVVDGIMVFEKCEEIAPGLSDRFIFCSGGAFTDRARRFQESVDNVVLKKPMDFKLISRLIAQSKERSGSQL